MDKNDPNAMLRQWSQDRLELARRCRMQGDKAGERKNLQAARLYEKLMKQSKKEMINVTYFTIDEGTAIQHDLTVESDKFSDAFDAAVKAGANPFSKMYYKVVKRNNAK